MSSAFDSLNLGQRIFRPEKIHVEFISKFKTIPRWRWDNEQYKKDGYGLVLDYDNSDSTKPKFIQVFLEEQSPIYLKFFKEAKENSNSSFQKNLESNFPFIVITILGDTQLDSEYTPTDYIFEPINNDTLYYFEPPKWVEWSYQVKTICEDVRDDSFLSNYIRYQLFDSYPGGWTISIGNNIYNMTIDGPNRSIEDGTNYIESTYTFKFKMLLAMRTTIIEKIKSANININVLNSPK